MRTQWRMRSVLVLGSGSAVAAPPVVGTGVALFESGCECELDYRGETCQAS